MVTGSIVLYNNNILDVKNAIQSFLKSEQEVRLFLIDNSEKDTFKKLNNDSRITYIFNNQNLGFGKAHNIAIKLAIKKNSSYHVVLNPDVYFDTLVIPKLYQFMEKNTDIGLTMPKVFFPNGDTQYICKLLPTPFNLILRRFLPKFKFLEKINHRFEMRFTQYQGIIDAPYLSGCFMFLRTETLKELGGFNENIFMYLEDTELTRIIHKKYRTVMNCTVFIYHKWEKGSYKNKTLLRHNIQSAIYYFNKWGWFFDAERKKINKQILQKYKR